MIGLKNALARGAKVQWQADGSPRLFVPRGMRDALKKEKAAIREILDRAAIFREQLKEKGPVPFLVLPDAEESNDGCPSCGGEVSPDHFRCPLCEAAAWIALEMTPPPTEER